MVPREVLLSIFLNLLSCRTQRLKGSPGSGNTAQITAAGEGVEKGDEDEEEGGKRDKEWRKEETRVNGP